MKSFLLVLALQVLCIAAAPYSQCPAVPVTVWATDTVYVTIYPKLKSSAVAASTQSVKESPKWTNSTSSVLCTSSGSAKQPDWITYVLPTLTNSTTFVGPPSTASTKSVNSTTFVSSLTTESAKWTNSSRLIMSTSKEPSRSANVTSSATEKTTTSSHHTTDSTSTTTKPTHSVISLKSTTKPSSTSETGSYESTEVIFSTIYVTPVPVSTTSESSSVASARPSLVSYAPLKGNTVLGSRTDRPAFSPAGGVAESYAAQKRNTAVGPYPPPPVEGNATSYHGRYYGQCSLDASPPPSGVFGVALSGEMWDSALHCGECVSVVGPNGNYIKAMVMDRCDECPKNELRLFSDAFAALVDPQDTTSIPVTWSMIPCDFMGSYIVLQNSVKWDVAFSMRVLNANIPISKFEVSMDNGENWETVNRTEDNYFRQPRGFGNQAVDVRLTCVKEGTGPIVAKRVGRYELQKTNIGQNFH